MQQDFFTPSELRRIGMIGNSTDSFGIVAFNFVGEPAVPYINGSVPIHYNADGGAIKELISGKIVDFPQTSELHNISADQGCVLILTVIKLRSFFANRYVANVSVFLDDKQYYLGSFAARSLENQILLAKAVIGGNHRLSKSTNEAISNS